MSGTWTRARPWVVGLTEAALAFVMLPETRGFPSVWGHEQPPAVVFASPSSIDTMRAALAAFVVVRRLARPRGERESAPLVHALVATLVAALACAPVFSLFGNALLPAALAVAAGPATSALAFATDAFTAPRATRASLVSGVCALVATFALCRYQGTVALFAFLNREPVVSYAGVLAFTWACATIVVCGLVRGRAGALPPEAQRALEACSLAGVGVLLTAWCASVYRDPPTAQEKLGLYVAFLPVGLATTFGLFAFAGLSRAGLARMATFATLALLLVGAVDGATPTRAHSAELYFPPAHPTHRVRLSASGAPRRERRPDESVYLEPLAIGTASPYKSCSPEDGAFAGRALWNFRVLHPGEAALHELELVLGRGARDQHLALCLDALGAYEISHVNLMGRVRVPFPWLSPLSRYTQANFPAVSVLRAPTGALRCDPADAARCTKQGTLRLRALLALARLP